MDGPKEKGAFSNPASPGHSTRFSTAFAVTSLLPASGPAPSASLRRHKFRIACFRLAAKMHSLHCASFPHKIFDFVGAPICCLRTGRYCRKAARASGAAGANASAKSAAAGSSAEAVPQPCAAGKHPFSRMTAPVNFRGFLGGEILRTVHRPETPGVPPEPSTAGPVGRGDAVKRVRFPACGETNDVEVASTRSDNFIPLRALLPNFPALEK